MTDSGEWNPFLIVKIKPIRNFFDCEYQRNGTPFLQKERDRRRTQRPAKDKEITLGRF
jgi:hypothetical protein